MIISCTNLIKLYVTTYSLLKRWEALLSNLATHETCKRVTSLLVNETLLVTLFMGPRYVLRDLSIIHVRGHSLVQHLPHCFQRSSHYLLCETMCCGICKETCWLCIFASWVWALFDYKVPPSVTFKFAFPTLSIWTFVYIFRWSQDTVSIATFLHTINSP